MIESGNRNRPWRTFFTRRGYLYAETRRRRAWSPTERHTTASNGFWIRPSARATMPLSACSETR